MQAVKHGVLRDQGELRRHHHREQKDVEEKLPSRKLKPREAVRHRDGDRHVDDEAACGKQQGIHKIPRKVVGRPYLDIIFRVERRFWENDRYIRQNAADVHEG